MNKKVEYSEDNLASLLTKVEDDFNEHLKKAETEKEEELVKKEADTKEAVDLKKSEDEVVFDYNDKDIAEMNGMYCSMNKAEKEAHYTSIKKALFGNEAPVKIAKTEKVVVKSVKKEDGEGLAGKLEKSEAKYDDLQKNFQNLLDKLGGFIKGEKAAPKQKSITKIEFINKSENTETPTAKKKEENLENLSKKEINDRLTLKARSSDLAKNDRETINRYYEERKEDIESIRHLL